MKLDRSPPRFGPAEVQNARQLIELALAEDLGPSGDVTSIATISSHARGSGKIVSRVDGVLAGSYLIPLLIESMHADLHWSPGASDGEDLQSGTIVGQVEGSMRDMLAFERTALNFLQRLSGIATLTSRFVSQVEGTRAQILDTRKTTPGWRALEKYAVRCGGGVNHRMSLSDMILIKDNHLAAVSGDIASAVNLARTLAGDSLLVELEVDTLDQFDRALIARPDIILVDNLGPDALQEAVKRRDRVAPSILLEASGGVTLGTVRALAKTGVDRISVGALTHSSPALDLGLDFSQGTNA